MQFKKFRSTTGKIFLSSISGHAAVLDDEFQDLPDTLWQSAYIAGAESEEYSPNSMKQYIAVKQEEAIAEEIDQLGVYKEKLKALYDSPVNALDSTGNLSYKAGVKAIGKMVKKEIMNELWKEIISEETQ